MKTKTRPIDAHAVAEIRRRLGLTQQELASMLGCRNRAQVCFLENGRPIRGAKRFLLAEMLAALDRGEDVREWFPPIDPDTVASGKEVRRLREIAGLPITRAGLAIGLSAGYAGHFNEAEKGRAAIHGPTLAALLYLVRRKQAAG